MTMIRTNHQDLVQEWWTKTKKSLMKLFRLRMEKWQNVLYQKNHGQDIRMNHVKNHGRRMNRRLHLRPRGAVAPVHRWIPAASS